MKGIAKMRRQIPAAGNHYRSTMFCETSHFRKKKP